MSKKVSILTILMIFPFFVFSQDIRGISPHKAFQMLKAPSTYLIDVRSVAEYVFVGHPEMAYNIPLKFWSEKKQELIPNENFTLDIKSRFKKDDILIFICRGGKRSLRAAELAREAGFANVLHIDEGFEGRKDERGYRAINGWKLSGLHYTYELNDELIYRPQKSSKKDTGLWFLPYK